MRKNFSLVTKLRLFSKLFTNFEFFEVIFSYFVEPFKINPKILRNSKNLNVKESKKTYFQIIKFE